MRLSWRGTGNTMYRLLLIEDRAEDAAMYRALLVGGKPPFLHDVELVWLPEAPALDTYQNVDCMITDYNLAGGVTGLDIARAAKAARPDLPIMLMTGAIPPDLSDEDRAMFVAVAEKDDLNAVWDGARQLMRVITGAK